MNETYNNKFAFWYCTYHDDGFLVKDDFIEDVPAWFKMCRSEKCSCSDWYRKGVIDYDGNQVREIEQVQTDYSLYSSDFFFAAYSFSYHVKPDDILLKDGTELTVGFEEIDILPTTHNALYNWFERKILEQLSN